jgi:hypothetical protein
MKIGHVGLDETSSGPKVVSTQDPCSGVLSFRSGPGDQLM